MMKKMKVGIAADHAGYELKEYLKALLIKMNYEVVDFGTHSTESMDYPDVAHPLALAVEDKKVSFGVAICGSGNGITITLNKHQGIRAALCWEPSLAALAKEHNNANVLSLPGRYISKRKAKAILESYLNAKFEGGRHLRRVKKIPAK